VTGLDRILAPRATGVSAGVSFGRADTGSPRARRRALRLGWTLAGAGLLLASLAIAPGIEGAFGGALALLMLAAASSDARRYIVPDAVSGGAFALGLVHAAFANPDLGFEAVLIALARAAMIAGLLWLLRAAYWRLRGRDGLGLGDVKLAAVAGAWLSLPTLPIALEVAAISAIAAYAFRQRKRARVLRAAGRVPFGAFFAPAIWLGWVLETMLPALS
jgi:leader peptidase (prepilin peptidase) / N-methyltransferase